jgi:hypothetical protein
VCEHPDSIDLKCVDTDYSLGVAYWGRWFVVRVRLRFTATRNEGVVALGLVGCARRERCRIAAANKGGVVALGLTEGAPSCDRGRVTGVVVWCQRCGFCDFGRERRLLRVARTAAT